MNRNLFLTSCRLVTEKVTTLCALQLPYNQAPAAVQSLLIFNIILLKVKGFFSLQKVVKKMDIFH
jgi:hypothetical protein